MSQFKIACPGCGQHIQGGDEYRGTQIECPSCKKTMVVPQRKGATPAAAAAPAAATGTPCPGCKTNLPAGTVVCTDCGYNLNTGKSIQTSTSPRKAARRAGSGSA